MNFGGREGGSGTENARIWFTLSLFPRHREMLDLLKSFYIYIYIKNNQTNTNETNREKNKTNKEKVTKMLNHNHVLGTGNCLSCDCPLLRGCVVPQDGVRGPHAPAYRGRLLPGVGRVSTAKFTRCTRGRAGSEPPGRAGPGWAPPSPRDPHPGPGRARCGPAPRLPAQPLSLPGVQIFSFRHLYFSSIFQ